MDDVMSSSEPNKERLRLWVEALRSGKYKQADRQLKRGDTFCCLGVACDISGIGKWDGDEYLLPDGYAAEFSLPSAVTEWLGFAEDRSDDNEVEIGEITDPILNPYRELIAHKSASPTITLAGLNDSGLTFNEIADVIERKWLS